MSAYKMTLTEYQSIVTPLVQELVKFNKKNKKYFMVDFNNVISNDFMTTTDINYSDWTHCTQEEKEKHMVSDWYDRNKVYPIKQTPAALAEQHANIISSLSLVLPASKLKSKKYFYDTLKLDEVKSNKRIIKDALTEGLYAKDLESGNLSMNQIEEILSSVGVRVPKSLESKNQDIKAKLMFAANPAMSYFMQSISDSFKQERENYYNLYTVTFNKQANRFVELVNDAKGTVSREAAQKVLSDFIQNNIYKLFKWEKNLLIKVDKFDAELNTLVEEYLVKMEENLLHALASKVQVILSELVNVKKEYLRVNALGLEGSFVFELTNGVFTVDTQAVFVQGEIQCPHYRYLAHYKKVIKDGVEYGTLNFEQFTKLFGKITK